jgi:nucleotide-binding universal stress UspA family protein
MAKTIVVPLDGSQRSQRALPEASWLARRLGVDVHLVTATYSSHPSAARAFLERSAELFTVEHVTPRL